MILFGASDNSLGHGTLPSGSFSGKAKIPDFRSWSIATSLGSLSPLSAPHQGHGQPKSAWLLWGRSSRLHGRKHGVRAKIRSEDEPFLAWRYDSIRAAGINRSAH